MAEQDRKDAVPSVLNDLIDVDGTPADGDGLAYTGGAWRPGVAAGLLPEFGPALCVWQGNYDGVALANNLPAIGAAWNAMVMAVTGTDTWPGTQPTLGGWGETNGYVRWLATEPGIYRWWVEQRIGLDGAPHSSGRFSMLGAQDWMEGWVYSEAAETVGPTGVNVLNQVQRYRSGVLFASQGMVDNDRAGVFTPSPGYETSGSERVTNLRSVLFVQQYSPGSTFDYYGNL